jgi:hypothetical protein
MNPPDALTYKLVNALVTRCHCNLEKCMDKRLKLGNIVQCRSLLTQGAKRQSVFQCQYTGSEICLQASNEDLSSWVCSLCTEESRDAAEEENRFEDEEEAEKAFAYAQKVRMAVGITFYTYLYI